MVDPFIVMESPHVFFVGNQLKFETDLVEGEDGQQVRIVMLPEFSTSHTVALVELETLNCIPMTFSVYDDKQG
jgi:DNA polymerase delta subunit 2